VIDRLYVHFHCNPLTAVEAQWHSASTAHAGSENHCETRKSLTVFPIFIEISLYLTDKEQNMLAQFFKIQCSILFNYMKVIYTIGSMKWS